MDKVNWKKVWDMTLKDKELFPIVSVNDKSVSIACPTRFSDSGEFSVSITPSFNDGSIVLELLVFNDNLSIDDLKKFIKDNNVDSKDFNKYAGPLVQYELSNRLMERFAVKSKGFMSDEEAKNALVDYINSKATESGKMFDDKLDELNDSVNNKKEGYITHLNKILENRRFIMQKIESILSTHYNWKQKKNEDYGDPTASLYDTDGNLAAVVSLVDDCILVDVARGVTAKVSLMQSDEDIAAELTNDIDAAKDVLADREIDRLKDIVADNEDAYMESLSRRVTKLESLLIHRRLHRTF